MDPSFASWNQSSSGLLAAAQQDAPSPADTQAKDKQKKPRHRHSPTQLAALNELYEKNEHPALELRTSLAERLGMYVCLSRSLHRMSHVVFSRETKTVNAWFQNKRASSKKRTRGVPYDVPPISSHLGSTSSSVTNTPRHVEPDDFHDDEYLDSLHHNSRLHQQQHPLHHSRSASVVTPDNMHPVSTFYAGNPDHTHFLAETDTMPRRMRMRPTTEQTDELRKLYNVNPHPTTDQRQVLSERIGMYVSPLFDITCLTLN